MKKANTLITAALTAGMVTSVLALPTSAGVVQKGAVDASKLPEGTLIYSEDFDGFTSDKTDIVLAKLGWEKVETLTAFTMNLQVNDGKLIVDNIDAASNDSYALIMDSDYLKNVCNQDYTYEYEIKYTATGNNSRYISLLCNYDGKDNYNTADIRVGGGGYNQLRKGSSWIHYQGDDSALRASGSDSLYEKLFGSTHPVDGMDFMNKSLTIRVETSIANGPTVYVNGIKAGDMVQNKDQWNSIDSYAICFKASKLISAEIDNIRIWTGLSDAPIEPVAEPIIDTNITESAKTGDSMAVILLASMAVVCAAFAVKAKKSK
ncbi:MAG: hypothetical protein HFE63_06440 [Clostridiales bacterium]|nr:hypothetical protein [Clostridiales bacterium]